MNKIACARDLVNTLYLGDRRVRHILLDGENRLIKICVDNISRVNPQTGVWDFYDAEDVLNGALVFEEVTCFSTGRNCALLNDEISFIECVESTAVEGEIVFLIGGVSVDSNAVSHDVEISIAAQWMHIEESDGVVVHWSEYESTR